MGSLGLHLFHTLDLIHRSAWKGRSPNFAPRGFSEVRRVPHRLGPRTGGSAIHHRPRSSVAHPLLATAVHIVVLVRYKVGVLAFAAIELVPPSLTKIVKKKIVAIAAIEDILSLF